MPGRYNEILVGRYNRFLQKLLSMKGPPPAPQFASELMAVIPLMHGVENRYLEAWERFGLANNQTATAAQNSAIQWRNPAGSNIVVVIEKMNILSDTSGLQGSISIQTAPPDLTTSIPSTGARLDNRTRPNSSLIISKQNNTGNLAAIMGTFGCQAANAVYDVIGFEDQEMTMLPGDGIRIASNTVNINLIAGIIWRERVLEDSERS